MTEVKRLRVVLIGGSGFLGRELRARLVSSGHQVTIISRGPSMTKGLERAVLLRPAIAIGGVGDPVSTQLGSLARFGLKW